MKTGTRALILLFGDTFTLVAAFWVMLYVAFGSALTGHIVGAHFWPFALVGAMSLLIFFIFNLYNTEIFKPTIPHLRHTCLGFLTIGIIAMLLFYTIPALGITPKTNLLIFCVSSCVFFILWRRVFYNIFSKYFRKNAVFIADGARAAHLVLELREYIRMYPQSGFADNGSYASVSDFFASYEGPAPEVCIVTKDAWRNPDNFKKLHSMRATLVDLAYAYEDILARIPTEVIDEEWFMYNISAARTEHQDMFKRAVDIAAGVLILVLASPILLIAALLIKLSDGGAVFYTQTRTGKNGTHFRLYKFRSMKEDAETNGPEWSGREDPRVTAVGKVLRKLHIDELPQMINVLKGDLAFVGPRPERPEFVAALESSIPFYHLRHIITPGFTGWAQIKFRYARTVVESKEKFEYDLYYLKNRNIFMDIGIVLRTIQIIFTH